MNKLEINVCDTCYNFKGCVILDDYQLCSNPKCACYYKKSVLEDNPKPYMSSQEIHNKAAENMTKAIMGFLLEIIHKQNE